jgi:hypothetical protein
MIAYNFVLVLLMVTAISVKAQHFVVNLSSKHQQKLASVKDGHKRLVKYYRFLKKDSIRQRKRTDWYYEKQLDSAWRVYKQRSMKRLEDSAGREKVDKVLSDTLNAHLVHHAVFRSLDTARLHNAELNLPRNFSHMDALSSATVDENLKSDHLSGAIGAPVMPPREGEWEGGLRTGGSNPFDSAMVKRSLEKLRQQAGDHFDEHSGALESAQLKLQKLLSRYREFSNSADLQNAVKHTSLKGKQWTERLVAEGGLNIVSAKPFCMDIAPTIGYKFNASWIMGTGFRHRLTAGDSIPGSLPIHSTGIRLFTQVDLWRSVYVQGEWEHTRFYAKAKESPPVLWTNNCFVGVGRKMLIHPRIYLTLTVLYNLAYDDRNPTYPGRLVIRPGFQLSELAVRKKRLNYDPNR